jgi:hypothetical protein
MAKRIVQAIRYAYVMEMTANALASFRSSGNDSSDGAMRSLRRSILK